VRQHHRCASRPIRSRGVTPIDSLVDRPSEFHQMDHKNLTREVILETCGFELGYDSQGSPTHHSRFLRNEVKAVDIPPRHHCRHHMISKDPPMRRPRRGRDSREARRWAWTKADERGNVPVVNSRNVRLTSESCWVL